MLKIDNIKASYGPIRALHGISIEINESEIITLIGNNGSGKTTTLMVISGILPCTEGKITFQDEDITNLSPHNIVQKGIVHVPEGRHIFPNFTVLENLLIGTYLRKDKHNFSKELDHIYSFFPILQDRSKQKAGTLSGGEQQMLAIGRALMAKPKLLLLDEPSLGLAPIIIQQIFNLFEQIRVEYNMSIFLIEQNANLALQKATRAYVLENGEIVMQGDAKELAKSDEVRKAYLGAI